ncbi:hypothetical protein NN3_24940 [Nocardia neocaledoniensis NBRC 108232]|uniref:hypothetical protein n=1 Tax=Nocardia neocaledoniensis TaxID=236511 RepID=UPI00119048EB|nr:hypothetical protein [Nocardia neocaledoniensis]GEM31487.1 hypothetical protein NN3_24940 [Nocardia neocaledoniensis NBRC 108232]
MGDIDPLADKVNHLQSSLGSRSPARSDGDLVRLEVNPDGTIRDVQLSGAARALTPDELVVEIVRVHTAAVEESQKAISAAIAALEADPRLATLTERRADALSQPTPGARSTSPAPSNTSEPEPSQPATTPPRSAVPSAPTQPRLHNQPASAPASRFVSTPPPAPRAVDQPQTRSRQPTPEEEEEMDRYYGRKSWLEY